MKNNDWEIKVKILDEDSQEQTKQEPEQPKTIKSLDTNYTQIFITAFILFIVWIFAWMWVINAFQDTWIQDNIKIIQWVKKDTKIQQLIIERANKKITTNSGTIEKSQKILKDKYNIIYN